MGRQRNVPSHGPLHLVTEAPQPHGDLVVMWGDDDPGEPHDLDDDPGQDTGEEQ